MKIDEAADIAAGLLDWSKSELEKPQTPEQLGRLRVVHGKASALSKFLDSKRRAAWGKGPETLRALMLERGINGKDLAREAGLNASVISCFLNRTRGISTESRVKLAERFGVEPSAFL
jgi:antitoxin component HigA of HigAB toxin-antitoxin module